MPLLRRDREEADDWPDLADEAPLPEDGAVIVSLERWRRDRERLLARGVPLGLRLRADQSPAELADDLGRFALVALEFARFTDGRAYSHARLLRERFGFAGELRAVGQVLRDQLAFMRRCGFDAFVLPEGAVVEDWLTALHEVSVLYQPAADGDATVLALRHRRAAAE